MHLKLNILLLYQILKITMPITNYQKQRKKKNIKKKKKKKNQSDLKRRGRTVDHVLQFYISQLFEAARVRHGKRGGSIVAGQGP